MARIVLAVRLLIGIILIAAGVLKVGHAVELAASIASFRLIIPPIVAPLALALPWIEIILGLYLVVGLLTRIAGFLTALQFIVYAGAIASAIVRHLPANCGCFGPYDNAAPDWPHVVLDLVLASLAAFVAYRAPGALALDRRMSRP